MSNAHSSMAGANLHDPKGKFPTALELDDATAAAYLIEDSAGQAIVKLDTLNDEALIGSSLRPMVLQFFSGLRGPKRQITGSADITIDDFVVFAYSAGGVVTANLPAPGAGGLKRLWLFVDNGNSWGTNSFTLDRSNGGNIDGAASNKTFSTSGGRVWVYCDGTDFWTSVGGTSASSAVDSDQAILAVQVFS